MPSHAWQGPGVFTVPPSQHDSESDPSFLGLELLTGILVLPIKNCPETLTHWNECGYSIPMAAFQQPSVVINVLGGKKEEERGGCLSAWFLLNFPASLLARMGPSLWARKMPLN